MSTPKKAVVPATKPAKPATVATKENFISGAAVGAISVSPLVTTTTVPSVVDSSFAISSSSTSVRDCAPVSIVASTAVSPAPKGSVDTALQGMKVYITSLLKYVASDLNISEEKVLASATKYDSNVVVTVASLSGKRTRSLPSEKKPKLPTKIAGKICEFVPTGGRGSKCKEEVSVRSKTGKYCSRHMRKEKCQGKNKQGETCGSLVVEGDIYCAECLARKDKKEEKSVVSEKNKVEKKPKTPKKEEEDEVVDEETSNDEVTLDPEDDE
jgi:hypothetical protein